MCPIRKAAQLSSLVDESVFLKEVDAAFRGLGAQPTPQGGSVVDAAERCLERLSGVLLEGWDGEVPGRRGDPPLTGVIAPVDLDATCSDPACTVDYFSEVLRGWKIELGASAAIEQRILDALRGLTMDTGVVHGLRDRVDVPGEPAIGWAMRYLPFLLLSGETGLLFAFIAAQERPGTRR